MIEEIMSEKKAEAWAICELLGHVRIARRLREEEKFGGKIARLDIPQGEGFITTYFQLCQECGGSPRPCAECGGSGILAWDGEMLVQA